jgi:hypothetical protein
MAANLELTGRTPVFFVAANTHGAGTCSARPSSPPVSTQASTSAMCRSPPSTLTRAPSCVMTGPEEPGPPPNYILAAYMGSGTGSSPRLPDPSMRPWRARVWHEAGHGKCRIAGLLRDPAVR